MRTIKLYSYNDSSVILNSVKEILRNDAKNAGPTLLVYNDEDLVVIRITITKDIVIVTTINDNGASVLELPHNPSDKDICECISVCDKAIYYSVYKTMFCYKDIA